MEITQNTAQRNKKIYDIKEELGEVIDRIKRSGHEDRWLRDFQK